MLTQDQRLLDAVVGWYDSARAELVAGGVDVQLLGPTTGRSKNSVSIRFGSALVIAEATVWDSGESEVTTAYLRVDADPQVELVQLDSEPDVERLLTRTAAWVRIG